MPTTKKLRFRKVIVDGKEYNIPEPCPAGNCFMDCPLYNCGECQGGFGHNVGGMGFHGYVRNLHPYVGCPWHQK